MFKFLKNMCGHCGCGSSSKKEEENQYKCGHCGKTSKKTDKCCDETMEEVCDCGSGKYAKECCKS